MTLVDEESRVSVLLRGVDIPACPAVLLELDAELRKDAPHQRAVANLISRDVALAGRVMRVANSSAFSGGRQVHSIAGALEVLGLGRMFNLVATQLLRAALSGRHDVSMDRFWDNSAATARVAEELARVLRCVKPDMAYTFGLFHDCGIPLLMKRFGNYRQVLVEANAAVGSSFTAVEEAHLGTNHAVVGYFLARRWRLPEFVAQGILLHHDYDVLHGSPKVPQDSLAVIALNVLAEHIIRQHARLGEENEWIKAKEHVSAFLGLSAQDITDLGEDVLHWLESGETLRD